MDGSELDLNLYRGFYRQSAVGDGVGPIYVLALSMADAKAAIAARAERVTKKPLSKGFQVYNVNAVASALKETVITSSAADELWGGMAK